MVFFYNNSNFQITSTRFWMKMCCSQPANLTVVAVVVSVFIRGPHHLDSGFGHKSSLALSRFWSEKNLTTYLFTFLPPKKFSLFYIFCQKSKKEISRNVFFFASEFRRQGRVFRAPLLLFRTCREATIIPCKPFLPPFSRYISISKCIMQWSIFGFLFYFLNLGKTVEIFFDNFSKFALLIISKSAQIIFF